MRNDEKDLKGSTLLLFDAFEVSRARLLGVRVTLNSNPSVCRWSMRKITRELEVRTTWNALQLIVVWPFTEAAVTTVKSCRRVSRSE